MDAQALDAVASKIRGLNATAWNLETAACEGQIRIPRVGCLGIGSAKNQSPSCIKFFSLITLLRFKQDYFLLFKGLVYNPRTQLIFGFFLYKLFQLSRHQVFRIFKRSIEEKYSSKSEILLSFSFILNCIYLSSLIFLNACLLEVIGEKILTP